MLQSRREQANEYTHYSDPTYEFRTPLQSLLLNMKKEQLLDILTVYLVNTNAKIDYCVVGRPPLHMAIEVNISLLHWCTLYMCIIACIISCAHFIYPARSLLGTDYIHVSLLEHVALHGDFKIWFPWNSTFQEVHDHSTCRISSPYVYMLIIDPSLNTWLWYLCIWSMWHLCICHSILYWSSTP